MKKETSVEVPAHSVKQISFECDICKKEITHNAGTFYSTCDICNKDICIDHRVHRPDMVSEDRDGEYPPVCTECAGKVESPAARAALLEQARSRVIEAAMWVTKDAAFKAPEQFGDREVTQRWIDRLNSAVEELQDLEREQGEKKEGGDANEGAIRS